MSKIDTAGYREDHATTCLSANWACKSCTCACHKEGAIANSATYFTWDNVRHLSNCRSLQGLTDATCNCKYLPRRKILDIQSKQVLYMYCLECRKEFEQYSTSFGQVCRECLDKGYMQIFVTTDND